MAQAYFVNNLSPRKADMKIIKNFLFVLQLPVLLFAACTGFTTTNIESSARTFIQKFCDAEFTGVEERFDYIKYSEERRTVEKAKDPSLKGMVIHWDGTPVFVVKSYSVVNVQIDGDEGTAQVEYERLASSRGQGSASRKLVFDYLKNDIVNIKMFNDGNRWWVIDPPPPRISKNALIRFYKNRLDRMGSGWDKNLNLTEIQKSFYRNSRETYEFLMKLDN